MKRIDRSLLICLGLIAAVVAAYWRVGSFGFLNYDDIYIFSTNPYVRNGLAWDSIVWGATTCYYEYWHPLMWWSHMMDCQLFGMNAGAHHLVNLAFHVTNTVLVFAVFRRMTGKVWRSAVVAALFGLHPLHVESVAWLSERKDLLSSFFWLLSVWAYVRYVEGVRAQSPKARVAFRMSLLFFVLGLLSKPMVVTLPFVLLLLDYWPLGRMPDFRSRISDFKAGKTKDAVLSLLDEKRPFFALMVLFCCTTWYSVKLGNKFPTLMVAPRSVRLENIPVAYVRYLWKTVFPRDLAVLYPMPAQLPWWQPAAALVLLIFISWVAARAYRARYLFFGWFMFLGVLAPTIGIVQVGAQALADRYTYLPSIGLFAGMVWAVAEAWERFRWRPFILGTVTTMILGACGWLSFVQTQYWHDSTALWTHCIAAGSESIVADQDLGMAYFDAGENDKALERLQAALRFDPNNPVVNLSYGEALLRAGQPKEATNHLAITLQSNPQSGEAHQYFGNALLALGDKEGAVAELGEAIRWSPVASAYTDMGRALSAQGNSDEALKYYTIAVNMAPEDAAAHFYRGMENLKRGLPEQAEADLEKAVELNPGQVSFHVKLAEVYSQEHRTDRAIPEYRKALELDPKNIEALNNLAWILATTPEARFRNGAEAVELAQRACEQTSWQQTVYVGTLAAAHAEAGDFDKAAQMSQKACELASAHGEKDLLQANQALLEQFKKQQPHREGN
jgi:tetratricopeptide (TPR) repeat protein